METSEAMMDKQALLNQRQTQVSYTTSLFKAYKSTYNTSETIEISIPPTRQMINPADLIIYFRPIVKYQAWADLTDFQNSQRCLTGINAASHLTVDSITINNQQILAAPRQNNLYARTILDQYIKTFLKTKPIKSLGVDGIQLTTGYMSQAGSAMNAYNVIENTVLTPCNGLITHPSLDQYTTFVSNAAQNGGILIGDQANVRDRGQNSSIFDGDYRPKATVSQMYNYFYNVNLPCNDAQNAFACSYYEQKQGVGLGNPRKQSDGVGSSFPASNEDLTFPNLCRAMTPSISLYRRQQESFLAYRQRFIQIQVGPYKDTSIGQAYGAKVVVPDQFQGYLNAPELTTNKGFDNLTSQDGVSAGEEVKTAKGKITLSANQRAMAGKLVDCRFSYGVPIQQQIQSDYSRYQGQDWTTGNSTFKNAERLTVVGVRLGDISQELEQIGTLAMEKTRLDISLFVNVPECCLSSYLQPSLILDPLNSLGSGPLNASVGTNAVPPVYSYADAQAITGSPQYYKKFLDLCQIGSGVQLTLNDVMMRVEAHNYSMNAYPLVKEILYQPKPYQTFRFSNKTITGSGPMMIPINLGVSSTVRSLFYFIIPRSNKFTQAVVKRTKEKDNALPQDSMVEYGACSVPQRGDLRSTILDSYYINHESYVTIDNERFDQTSIPLGEPQLNQYLLTSSALQTALNRYMDIDLQSFTHNRFMGCISVDPTGSRKFISQQLEFTIIIDDRDRVRTAELFNLHSRSISGQFEVIAIAVVGQTVVECQRVIV